MSTISKFRGLNNVVDPMRLDMSWLVRADNVDITSTDGIKAREGQTLAYAGSITGACNSIDFERMYFVDGGALKAKTSEGAVTLRTGLSTAPMYWAEINEHIYYNNGTDSGVIREDHSVIDWRWTRPDAPSVTSVSGSLTPGAYQVRCVFVLADGRATGASDAVSVSILEDRALQISSIPQLAGARTDVYITDANSSVFSFAASTTQTALVWDAPSTSLGRPLFGEMYDPLPLGADVIQFWRARAYAAQDIGEGTSVIWASQPMGFHLFNLAQDAIVVKGRVLMLAPLNEALLIGTTDAIYAYDGKTLADLAPYGVIPGWGWDMYMGEDEGAKQQVLMWTARGLCRAMPFTNLTSGHVSVAPGVRAGAAVVDRNGEKKFVVALHQGGSAFNKRN